MSGCTWRVQLLASIRQGRGDRLVKVVSEGATEGVAAGRHALVYLRPEAVDSSATQTQNSQGIQQAATNRNKCGKWLKSYNNTALSTQLITLECQKTASEHHCDNFKLVQLLLEILPSCVIFKQFSHRVLSMSSHPSAECDRGGSSPLLRCTGVKAEPPLPSTPRRAGRSSVPSPESSRPEHTTACYSRK